MKPRIALLAGLAMIAALGVTGHAPVEAGQEASPASFTTPESQIVAMRRLTREQYRNAIHDIFGPGVEVVGRFEPIVRPVHEMIASGARHSGISPAGLESFDAMARNIAAQVFGEEMRGQFVSCAPVSATKADADCARATLAPIGRYLFRRPLTQSEEDFYVTMAGKAAGPTGSFDKGLELALSAMLVSPNFLYVIEVAEPDPDKPGALRLDNWSRASRLSFMLWNSTPNERLLRAAAEGKLTDQRELDALAKAMVDSPRFEQGVRAFFADMLVFEKFDEIAKDPLIYPYFNQDVAKALPEQTLRTIVDHLVTRGEDYRGLFTTTRTFMNRPLASLYQVPVKNSQGWEEYSFDDGDDRAGILGQAGLLALYSHSGRSSPTLRGRAIRELLLCQPVPDPPGDVNFTAVQDTENKAMPTARIRLTRHRTDPVCAGCHQITDPIGLSLERFDGIGAWRTTENGAQIDVSGSFDGTDFVGASGLGKAMAQSESTTRCVTGRVLEYATAHPSEEQYQLVGELEEGFAASGYRIRDLFYRVATLPEAYRIEGEALDRGQTKVSLVGGQD
ncbi:MAG: DUF1588 domain-containing protein [Sphingomonadaceae bacterium]